MFIKVLNLNCLLFAELFIHCFLMHGIIYLEIIEWVNMDKKNINSLIIVGWSDQINIAENLYIP